MNITGGKLVAKALQKNEIKLTFGLVGNHLSPIFVYLQDYGIRLIDVRHEQAAVLMADGFAQVERKPAVAMVVGGPGFTNAISGIVKAYMANTPMLVILGAPIQTKKDKGSLQDMEQIQMIKPYTKWAASIQSAERIPEYINMALQRAVSGRRGPVVLEIPINVLKSEVEENQVIWPHYQAPIYDSCLGEKAIEKIVSILKQAKNPIVIAGDEVYYNNAENELVSFIERSRIPVFTVNKARGCIPDKHSLCFGNGRILEAGFCMYAYSRADCILNLGIYSNYEMGFYEPPIFSKDATMITIVQEPEQCTAQNGNDGFTARGSMMLTLQALTKAVKENNYSCSSEWVKQLKKQNKLFWEDILNNQVHKEKVNPVQLISTIQNIIPEDSIIILDGSNSMFWGSLLFTCNHPGQIIIAPDGTFGAMGGGLPLALSAKIANDEKTVILYTGDGSFGFNMAEIDTAIRWNIKVVTVIHNDRAWGFCKATQEASYGEEKVAYVDLQNGNYEKIVEAAGGYGDLVETNDEIDKSLKAALISNSFACLNVIVDEKMQALGALSFNESLKK